MWLNLSGEVTFMQGSYIASEKLNANLLNLTCNTSN